MSKTLGLISNADDSTMVDFRRGSQIDSVPIAEIRALLDAPIETVEPSFAGLDMMLINQVAANIEKGMDGKDAVDAVLGPYRPIPFTTRQA